MQGVNSGLFSASNNTALPLPATLIVEHPQQSSTVRQEHQDSRDLRSTQDSSAKNALVVELSMNEDTTGIRESDDDQGIQELIGEWAVMSPKEKVDQVSEIKSDIVLEDLEGTQLDVSTDDNCQTSECYLFEKLSDVPAVRDQKEIEAADRALEALSHKPPHQLTATERVWELAARGGSTQPNERVDLDYETKEKVKETLRKNKLMDKTTLAF